MSGVLAGFPSGKRALLALPPRGEERWIGGARPPAATTAVVLALSAVLHGILLIATLLADPPATPNPQREISVEIVPDVPKPPATKPPADKSPAEKSPAATPPASEPAAGKPVENRPAERPEPPQPAPAKPAPAQPAPAKPEPAKATEKAAEKAAEKPPQQPARPSARDRDEADLKEMRDELARLKSEQAALQAQAAAPEGLGPLPSFQAIALPGETATGDGDVVGYAAVVFSRLAKAKAIGREMGEPGTAGVSFEIDDRGALLDVRLAASSGIAGLDEEALAIVRKAAPFPPPPEARSAAFQPTSASSPG